MYYTRLGPVECREAGGTYAGRGSCGFQGIRDTGGGGGRGGRGYSNVSDQQSKNLSRVYDRPRTTPFSGAAGYANVNKHYKNRPVGSESEGRGDQYSNIFGWRSDRWYRKQMEKEAGGADGEITAMDEGVKPIGEIKPNVEESGGINIWQIAAMGLAVVGAFTLVKMIK